MSSNTLLKIGALSLAALAVACAAPSGPQRGPGDRPDGPRRPASADLEELRSLVPAENRTEIVVKTIDANGAISLDKRLTVRSVHDFATTLTRLKSELTAAGLTIFTEIDHAAGAAKAGEALSPTTVVIFGNPKMGTALIQANQDIGLDLPLKILVKENAGGEVSLTYADPQAFAARYDITDRYDVVERMTKALAGITGRAAGE